MPPSYWLFLLILFAVMLISVIKKKLTLAGAITGGVIGCCIFLGTSFTGIAMLGLFFLLGTLATSWKFTTKERLGAAEKNTGGRTAGQAIANGGVAGILGLLAWTNPHWQALLQIMMAASLASATADTLSSELGTVYGKKFINILSFKQEKRGENGVVSLEGTLLGIFGSILIAILHATGTGWNKNFFWIVLAGTLGNIADSVMGATLERKNYLKNDAVNFINTLTAALMALIFVKLF